MRALVIEDNDLKFELLACVLREHFHQCELIRACSYQAGVAKLVQENFGLVLLDMTLPVSDLELSPVGMEWLNFGGQLVLRECKRRKVSVKIIVVSQFKTFVRDNEEISFEQLRGEILEQHKELVAGCVYLDRVTDNWRQEILNLI
jgi:DNA-binding response OmpR family regulator